MKQSLFTRAKSLLIVVMLSALVLLLTACGTTSPVCPTESQPLPAMPSISTPLPSVSYSISAQQDIQAWQAKLRATRLMSD